MTQTLDASARKSALQYVTTDDGYRIAYTVSGEGEPFLFTPCLLQNDILRHDPGTADFVQALEARFRLIRYDGRGTGNSTRGLNPEITIEDTLRDLVAVVEALRLDRFILYGDVFSSYMLLQAVCLLRHSVKALIMANPVPFNGASLMPSMEPVYTESWELFTNTFATTYRPPGSTGEDMRAVVDHEDFVRLARSARGYYLKDVLSKVTTPTLVLVNRNPVDPARAATGSEIASTVPNSRLVLFDGHSNFDFLSVPGGGLPPAMPAIEDFLASIPSDRTPDLDEVRQGKDPGLSHRELEVLRLLVTGHSNQAIAESLVISASTVAKHVSSILSKTGTANRVEVTSYAHRHRLV
jgi:DNA-binding CsgD family transcriptional regulator/pimeloyl-ACP methyl ester carboxylesterase